MNNLLRMGAVLAICLLPLSAISQPAAAQFYKGKTITVLIGFPAGGGIDRMARVLTEKLSDVVPGNPTIVIKTMPGAGGNKALNFAYTKGEKDGTFMWFGPVQFHSQILGSKAVRYDLSKFHILAAMRGAPVVMYGRPDVVPGGLKMSEASSRVRGSNSPA